MSTPTGKSPLHKAILNFELDDPEAGFSFSDRLARENRWTKAFTDRVLVEYKRFLILCAEGKVPHTPSDAVDQAWHLHLCYTDHYWNRLCCDTLGFELHHGPTKGGGKERTKHFEWYTRTLGVC